MKINISLCTALIGVLAVCILIDDVAGNTRERLSKKERQKKRKQRLRLRERNHRRRRITTTAAPRPCPPIPHVTNGQGLDTGNTVQYACEPGFVLEGTNVITCIDGRWTVAPRCRRQLCPQPISIPNAAAPVVTSSGTMASYTCNSGFRIQNGGGVTSRTISCDINTGLWPAIMCEAIPVAACGAPPVVANAVSTVDATGTMATYGCNTGYTLRSGSPTTIMCTNNVWPSVNIPVCDRDATVTPAPVTSCTRAPPAGDQNIKRENVADSYAIGGRVMYTCDTGYRIVGSNDNSNNTAYAFCQSDGTFSTAPTCEKVDCGTPPAGTNTNDVVASSTVFGATVTYTCITNYEASAENLKIECMADGKWSSTPTRTCTQKMCKKELLAAISTLISGSELGTIYTLQDVAIGGTIDFRCVSGNRVAPDSTPTTTTDIITVTCGADEQFVEPTQKCVYQFPTSCKDYFNRDNMFAGASLNQAMTVTIDPDGANTTFNPAEVSCVKTSATEVCTRVTPNGGATYSVNADVAADACIGTSSAVLDTTVFDDAGGAVSGVCPGTYNAVTYPLTNDQIDSMVRSVNGRCRQITTITCSEATNDPNGLAIALRTQTEPVSGYLYGTGLFDTDGTDIDLNHYTYANRNCDCADANPAITGAASATESCLGGCYCTSEGALTEAGSDTITKFLSPDNLDYVVEYELTQHNDLEAFDDGTWSVEVGHIECCDTA